MNENVARNIVLVRAIEVADQKREILTEDDRMYASRSAKELAQWQAADMATQVTAEHFLQHRAEQILRKIIERHPAFAPFIRRHHGTTLLWLVLPIVSLCAGIAVDRIANPHRVDLLSGPLLAIVGWNLLVYGVMLVSEFSRRARKSWIDVDSLRSLIGRSRALPRKLPSALSVGLANFFAEWSSLSRKLVLARWRRTMHLSAALFALGTIVSLYARGILSEYKIGWESTFLDANQVYMILATLFAPASAVFRLQPFTVADIQILHFSHQGETAHGARWVHLYAGTLLLIVVIPRAIFAAFSQWRAHRFEKNFPLDLQQPYFRQFNEVLGGRPMTLRVIPYSFTVDERRDKGLATIAAALLGAQTRVMLRPPLAYGEEPAASMKDMIRNADDITVSVVLFSLAATPEKETHGALLKYLAQQSQQGITALIDESTYQEKMGTHAQARMKLDERILLWQQFCNFHHVPAIIVNLLDPDTRPVNSGPGLKPSVTT